MADESLLATLSGAMLDSVDVRPDGGLALGLRLPEWCGRPGQMPRRVTLVLDAVTDIEPQRATLDALLEASLAGSPAGSQGPQREIVAIEPRSTRAGGAALRLSLAGVPPLELRCRDYRIVIEDDASRTDAGPTPAP